ncbi:MAG: response regulator transcription factor [Elusimicrobiota bacterium]
MKRVQKILVVDDDEGQRRLFSRRLGLERFEIFTANSGLDALPRIQELCPDLVLADIGMPQIDGIQMLKIMRQVPKVAAIPVILMTGMPIPESLLQAAADGLKAGPILMKGNFQQLLERINNVLKLPTHEAANTSPDAHILNKGPVTVDLIHREVIVAGDRVPRLTAKRFDVLLCLLRHDGPVDQDALLNDVWGHRGDIKLVQMTVSLLREHLRDFPALQIKTEGHSYKLVIALPPTKTAR